MSARASLCLAWGLLQVSCAATPRNTHRAVVDEGVVRSADASEAALLKVVAQIKPGTKLRLRLMGREEYRTGKFSHSNEQFLFLESATDSLEMLHLEEVWKSSNAPGYMVLTGAIIGGVLSAMVFNQDGYREAAIMFGFALGALVTFPASLAVPDWNQLFPMQPKVVSSR